MDVRGVLKVVAWTLVGGCFAVWAVLFPVASTLAQQIELVPMPWTLILGVIAAAAFVLWLVLQLLDVGPDFVLTGSPGSVLVKRTRRSTVFALVMGEGNIGSTDVIGVWSTSPGGGVDLRKGESHRFNVTAAGPLWFAWIDGGRLRSPSVPMPMPDQQLKFSGHEAGSESGR